MGVFVLARATNCFSVGHGEAKRRRRRGLLLQQDDGRRKARGMVNGTNVGLVSGAGLALMAANEKGLGEQTNGSPQIHGRMSGGISWLAAAGASGRGGSASRAEQDHLS